MTRKGIERKPIVDVTHVVGVAHNEAAMAKAGANPEAAAQAVMRLAHLAANTPGAIDALQVMHQAQQRQESKG